MTDKAKQSLSRSQRRIYHPTFPGRGTARYTGQAGELNINIDGREMNHNIFISYSSDDLLVANEICSALESVGIRCWIASRDIVPGQPYPDAVIDGITVAQVFLLILSPTSNTSGQVIREVERAVSYGIPIVPFQLGDFSLSKSMELFVSTSQRLIVDETSWRARISQLVRNVEKLGHLESRPDKGLLLPDRPSENLLDDAAMRVMCWEGHWHLKPLENMRVSRENNILEITNTTAGHNHAKIVFNQTLIGEFVVSLEMEGAFLDIQLQITDGQDRNIYVNPSEQGVPIDERNEYRVSRDRNNVVFHTKRYGSLRTGSYRGNVDMNCYLAIALAMGQTVRLYSAQLWSEDKK